MKQEDVFNNIARLRPSCILSLDNEQLSFEFSRQLNKAYGYTFKGETNIRPDIHLLTNTIANYEPRHEELFTKAYYTLALQQIQRRLYVSPSLFIGQYGAYEALKFAFSEGGFKQLIKENSILVSRHNRLEDVETARTHISENFRDKHNIHKEDTVVFFAPGDTIDENEYSLHEFVKGYNQFIHKYTYPTSLSPYSASKSQMKLIISVHKGTSSERYVREFLNNNKNNEYDISTDYIVVTNENNEHYSAICASDFGFVYNGQMLSSAAALHLDVITMQNMNDLHYYWHTWENRWLSDINVNADRPVIPEFAAGEYWFGKIANNLAEMHTNTERKWDQVRALRPFINNLLSYKELNRDDGYKIRDKEYIKGDRTEYDEYVDPIYSMSKSVYTSMSEYKNRIAFMPDISILKSIPSLKLNNSLSNKL